MNNITTFRFILSDPRSQFPSPPTCQSSTPVYHSAYIARAHPPATTAAIMNIPASPTEATAPPVYVAGPAFELELVLAVPLVDVVALLIVELAMDVVLPLAVVVPALAAEVVVAIVEALVVAAGAGTADVKGVSATLDAPTKAGAGLRVGTRLAGAGAARAGLSTLCELSVSCCVMCVLEQRSTYVSITCATPFARSTFGNTTLAWLRNTEPSMTLTTIGWPDRGKIVPLTMSWEKTTEPTTAWYCRTDLRVSTEALTKAEPAILKASSLGTKMVRSGTTSRVPIRSVAINAPAAASSLSSSAVVERVGGMVRTLPILWMVKPPTSMSCDLCQ